MNNKQTTITRGSRARNREVRKRYIRYNEGAVIYSMSQSSFEKYAKKAQATHKVGKIVLVDMEKFERFLEMQAVQ